MRRGTVHRRRLPSVGYVTHGVALKSRRAWKLGSNKTDQSVLNFCSVCCRHHRSSSAMRITDHSCNSHSMWIMIYRQKVCYGLPSNTYGICGVPEIINNVYYFWYATLKIISFSSPTLSLSFISDLKSSFLANPSHCSLFQDWLHDSPDFYRYFWAYPFLLLVVHMHMQAHKRNIYKHVKHCKYYW